MKKALSVFPAVALIAAASAQSFTESFDTGPAGWINTTVITFGNTPGGDSLAFSSGTWFALNNSSPVGSTGWYCDPTQFNPQFTHSGAGMLNANLNGTTGANTIDEWMMSPTRTFSNGDTISFFTRTTTPGLTVFPDRLFLKLSLSGSSTSVASFGTTLVSVNPNLTTTGYPSTWTQFSATVTGLGGPTSGRFAFNYNVTNGGPLGSNSDLIGIDDVVYSAVPEPTSLALLGMGAAVLLRRRKRN